ncbi:hypothetical protein BJV78DRAFT_462442 [Lactifluus subvellereus]|nr:hypothetical protein BJV78DRAFT_462442 [Lactifluus subvellereus]
MALANIVLPVPGSPKRDHIFELFLGLVNTVHVTEANGLVRFMRFEFRLTGSNLDEPKFSTTTESAVRMIAYSHRNRSCRREKGVTRRARDPCAFTCDRPGERSMSSNGYESLYDPRSLIMTWTGCCEKRLAQGAQPRSRERRGLGSWARED